MISIKTSVVKISAERQALSAESTLISLEDSSVKRYSIQDLRALKTQPITLESRAQASKRYNFY